MRPRLPAMRNMRGAIPAALIFCLSLGSFAHPAKAQKADPAACHPQLYRAVVGNTYLTHGEARHFTWKTIEVDCINDKGEAVAHMELACGAAFSGKITVIWRQRMISAQCIKDKPAKPPKDQAETLETSGDKKK